MNEKIPTRVYYRVAVQLFFTFIMVWYFSFKLLQLIFPLPEYFQLLFLVSIVVSIATCVSLAKRGIKDEMKNKDNDFYLVAQNPNAHHEKQKITKEYVASRLVASFFISLVVTLPVTAIASLKILSGKSSFLGLVAAFMDGYWKIYAICFGCVAFLSFFIKYVVDNWDWTKKQF